MRLSIWIILLFLLIIRIVFYYHERENFADGTRVKITARVTSEPIRYRDSQLLFLKGYRVYLPLYPEVYYGDTVIVRGTVMGNGLKNVEPVHIKEAGFALFSLRKKIISFYQSSVPRNHAALVAGVTFGSKHLINEEFWEDLKKTGTAHVVVASGMNVTLVAGFLMNFLVLFMNRKKAIFIALVGIWTYAFIAGFDAPIVRAAVMGSLVFSAQRLGRLYSAGRALFLAAIGMLLVFPSWLTDLGFILSFVATGSLMLFAAKIDRLIHFVPSILREGLSTSIAAQIGVAPIIWITFGQFNILSPLVNALVLWTIPYITILGMIAGFTGIIWASLGRVVLMIIYPMSLWFIGVVRLFS